MRWASWILLIRCVPDFSDAGQPRPVKNTSYVRQQGQSAGGPLLRRRRARPLREVCCVVGRL